MLRVDTVKGSSLRAEVASGIDRVVRRLQTRSMSSCLYGMHKAKRGLDHIISVDDRHPVSACNVQYTVHPDSGRIILTGPHGHPSSVQVHWEASSDSKIFQGRSVRPFRLSCARYIGRSRKVPQASQMHADTYLSSTIACTNVDHWQPHTCSYYTGRLN